MKRMPNRILLTVIIIVSSFLSFPLNGNADDAKQKYKKGAELFDKGEFSAAAGAFRAAYAAKPSWKVLYNIAQSEAAAKRHGLALEAFEMYLSNGGDDVPDSRREEVLAEVERLRKMVGSVEVKAPDGAIVFMDGVERGRAPLLGKLPVAASVKHLVWAELDGEKIAERAFKVMGGDSLKLDLMPPEDVVENGTPVEEDPIEEEPISPPPNDPERSKISTIGWVSVGVGAAMVIAGSITGGMAMSLDGDLYEQCEGSDHENCDTNRQSDIDKLNNLALTTDVLLFVGGAAVVTGAVLLVVDKMRGKEEDASSVAVSPAIAPGFAGAAIQGRF